MGKDTKNKTREIARDLIESMAAVRESCVVLGCEPAEARRYVKKFRDSELSMIADSALAERVLQLSQAPHSLYQGEGITENCSYFLDSFSQN